MNPDWLNFLKKQHAHIIDNRVHRFGESATEASSASSDLILTDLSHLGLIRFSSEDAQNFLQGQLSCDVNAVSAEQASYGGYCTPKGRLLCSFLLWRDTASDGYLLQLPVELIESIIKRLRMYVLRAKVTVEDYSDEIVRFGVIGETAQALLASNPKGVAVPATSLAISTFSNGHIICHSQQRFEILATPALAINIWEQLSKQAHPASATTWDHAEINEGIPAIFQATQEQFIPQMVNLDAIGGVSFKKGCYPGQEIVARTQYLGKVKRRMYRARLKNDATETVKAGDSLFSADTGNQACGMIVNAAPVHTGGTEVLAVIQVSTAESQSVHWQTPAGPQLELLPLPYSIE